ncbi:MAG: hypothetical protein MZW92_28930 [Comamonadaceae bacterium]|nr:hypothetical protein [Comamonadaceae bacterium]
MHDPSTCIGCRPCQEACPYSNAELDDDEPRRRDLQRDQLQRRRRSRRSRKWADKTALIPGCTAVGRRGGASAPARRSPAMNALRRRRRRRRCRKDGVVEKCTFCYHRTSQRPAAGLRRGVPVAGAHLRRPGRRRTRQIAQGAEGAEVVPAAGGQGHEAERALRRQVQRRAPDAAAVA